MGMVYRISIKLGLAILLSGAMGSATAYHHGKTITPVDTHVTSPANMPRFVDKEPSPRARKPEKCYLALHLDMVGTPFAARIADTGTVLAQQCDAELYQKARDKGSIINPDGS